MATIRDIIDGRNGQKKPVTINAGFKADQQVVVRRQVGLSSRNVDLRVATIMSFADRDGKQNDSGEFAFVSIPGPGVVRKEIVPLSSLSPVTKAFKRASVQFNSAQRF